MIYQIKNKLIYICKSYGVIGLRISSTIWFRAEIKKIVEKCLKLYTNVGIYIQFATLHELHIPKFQRINKILKTKSKLVGTGMWVYMWIYRVR